MWLIIPEFSPYSPEDPVSTSPSNSLFQKLARSALWRGTSKPPEFWQRAWKRATWLRRLSGLTCETSLAYRGVGAWISSLGASHARTSPSPEAVLGLMDLARGSGASSPGSFARWDPGSYSWRTSQLSLLGDSTVFSGTLPRSGSMRNGQLFPREPVVPRTVETGSSSWPTAAATDWKGSSRKGQRKGQLSEAAEQKWPTPRSSDGEKGGSSGDLMLPSSAVATCRSGPPGPETQPGETAPTLALNPRFVETLMGWPEGWTDCESSGTVSFRFRERWRSYLFSIV